MLDICNRHGLRLRTDGKMLPQKEQEKRFEDFVFDTVSAHILRKHDRTPVDRKTIEAWAKEINQPKNPKKPQPPGRFEAAATKVVLTKYGGLAALERRTKSLTARILGVHWNGYGEFTYDLTMPGDVVAANGQLLLGGGRVRWQFKSQDVYPFGFTMRCRSLDDQASLQEELLKGRPLEKLEARIAFGALVQGKESERRLAVLRQCAREKSMKPLYAYRQHPADATGKIEPERIQSRAEVKKVDQLLKLLNLPVREP